jgi:hypothetical protein
MSIHPKLGNNAKDYLKKIMLGKEFMFCFRSRSPRNPNNDLLKDAMEFIKIIHAQIGLPVHIDNINHYAHRFDKLLDIEIDGMPLWRHLSSCGWGNKTSGKDRGKVLQNFRKKYTTLSRK